jgi:hypothetical protein
MKLPQPFGWGSFLLLILVFDDLKDEHDIAIMAAKCYRVTSHL